MAQFARPTGDKADDGNWDSTNNPGMPVFYTEIDEATADDSDYITGDGSIGDTIEIDFDLTNGLTDPGVNTGHKLIVRYNTDGNSGDAQLTIRLIEGSFTRMQDTIDVSGVSSYTTHTYADPGVSISNYDNVFLRLIFEDSDAIDLVYISQAYLEIPDAPAGADAVPMALNTYQQMRIK
ncbi:MAG: hypothetical protein ACPGO0_00050 [Acidimicrobiales bacterium]|jgi:hypothetical protein